MKLKEAYDKSKFGQVGCYDEGGNTIIVFAEYGLRLKLMDVVTFRKDRKDWKCSYRESIPNNLVDKDIWYPVGPRKE